MSRESFLEKLLDGVAVEWKTIGEVFDLKNGYTPSKANSEYWTNGEVPWFRMEDIRANGRILKTAIQSVSASAVKGKLIPANSLIMSTTATLGEHALVEVPFLTNQQITSFSISKDYCGKVDVKFMFHYFFEFAKWCSENANRNGGMGIIGLAKLRQFEIPIPSPENPKKSLEIQAEIVRILDAFTELAAELTAELTARKKQYNHYRDQLLSFEDGDVEWKTLGDLCSIGVGQAPVGNEIGEYAFVNAGTTPSGYVAVYNTEPNTITTPSRGQGGIGYVGYQTTRFWCGPLCYRIRSTSEMLSTRFLYHVMANSMKDIVGLANMTGVPALNKKELVGFSVPIPPPAEQERIVAILDKFDALTNSITEGLPREIELRQKQYAYYRDLLLSFPKMEEIEI